MNIKKTFLIYFMPIHYLFGQGFWGSGFPEEKSNIVLETMSVIKQELPF